MRSMIVAACLASGLVAASAQAEARDRAAKPPHPSSHQNHSISKAQATAGARALSPRNSDGRFERQCVIMECGTPWCYQVRVN